MHVHEMISTHPRARIGIDDALIRCIEECHDCAMTCTSCADACLSEDRVTELRACIRLNMDCADICAATAAVATRRTGGERGMTRRMLEACGEVCRVCAEECERHAGRHDHCRVCAEACRRCESACHKAMGSVH